MIDLTLRSAKDWLSTTRVSPNHADYEPANRQILYYTGLLLYMAILIAAFFGTKCNKYFQPKVNNFYRTRVQKYQIT